MPPRFVPHAAPRCPRCNKMVYQAEQIIGPNGVNYHKACYTCLECSKRLDSSSLAEHNGQAYCKTCHAKKWGPTGYGYAGGAAFLQPEEPGNEFKSSLQRVPATHTGGSIHSNHSASGSTGSSAGPRIAPSSPAVLNYHNTGGSSSSQTSSPTFARLQKSLGETEEQEQERLTPVNATLKKRSSLDMIREQAEASRRAYDEMHAQRVAAHRQQQGSHSPTSSGTASPRHLTGNGSTSNLSVAGSDTSSTFGSTVANAGSPAPSFTSLSSTTSIQSTTPSSATSLGTGGGALATKTIYFNQPYRGGLVRDGNTPASTPTSSITGTAAAPSSPPQRTAEKNIHEEDPESVLAKSRQALGFQTGAGGSALPPVISMKSGSNSKISSAPKPVDESYMEFVPIRLVAKPEDGDSHGNPTPPSLPTRPPGQQQQQQQQQDDDGDDENDNWDPEDAKEGKRKQAILKQFYDNKAENSYAIQKRQPQELSGSESPPRVPNLSTTTVNQLVNDAKGLTVSERRYQAAAPKPTLAAPAPPQMVRPQTIQQQPAPLAQKLQQPEKPKDSTSTGPVDDDEWDDDPTPNTYESKELGMNFVGRNWN